jgi:hypothetical protein
MYSELRPVRSWAIGLCLTLALFACAYTASLTFVYIEGDDATSIAYHALGRVAALQPPYSAYQSMMDVLLSTLPANEHTLRIGGMLITALFAPVLVCLIALLAMDWVGGLLRIPAWAAVILIPILAPEFIYFGLVYSPALVAMSAALTSHLVLRRLMARSESQGSPIFASPWFALSIILFGAGAAFRWDILAYGGVIVTDLFLGVGIGSGKESPPRAQRLRAGFVWGAAAIATWLLMVAASGYGPAAILRTIRTAGPDNQYQNLLVTVATLQTLVTPALLVCACAGVAMLLRRRQALAIVFAVGLILVARVIKFGDPKYILVTVPALLACALAGFSGIWTYFNRGGKAYALRTALVLLLLAPWFFGVQTIAGDSAYGPGFDVQAFDRPSHPARFVRITAGPGALVPTLEGPRPIGGDWWVLFTGKWRQRVDKDSLERTIGIDSALARNLPLLQDNGEGYAVATLAGMGFKTQDSWKRLIGPSYVLERRFFSEDKKRQVRMLRLKDRNNLFTASGILQLEDISGVQTVVIYGYTSTLRRLYKIAPGALQKLDTATALLDLETLRHSLGSPI